jgi:hypothetical protein
MEITMAKQINFDDLPLVPAVCAQHVCETEYTGNEVSSLARCQSLIDKIEHLRQKMTLADIEQFCQYVDKRCRDAYDVKAQWFMKCLKGKTGRNQLYVWIQHWLSAFLIKSATLQHL